MEEVKPKNIFETPQGDERLGWTGDAEIFCRTACFLENTYSFYRKWLRDVEADQTEEGGVAHVVPDIISGNEGYNWLLEQGSHSAAARRFKIPGNTVEFVRDLRYNKYRVFTELQNEQKKKGCGRMIDIAHAKQEFEKYLDEYDREDEQICLKIVHTYGVVKYAGEIARKMEFRRVSFSISLNDWGQDEWKQKNSEKEANKLSAQERELLIQKKNEYDWDFVEEEIFNSGYYGVIIKTYITEERDVTEDINLIKEKIDGLKEFDHGPSSGWMYKVNGTPPNIGAGAYRLKAGDQVIWYYVNIEQ